MEEILDKNHENFLLALSNEVIILIFGYLPLKDLANIRLVCSKFQKLIDDDSVLSLWAQAQLCGMCDWVTDNNRAIIERAASSGNVEALIMLAVAYLYCEGISEGPGKGTLNAYNGMKAAECLVQAERLTYDAPPFSWVLFRPPWALSNNCYKACVLHHMKGYIEDDNGLPGISYCVGKALSFQRHSANMDLNNSSMMNFFKRGSFDNCSYSALEEWKLLQKPGIHSDEFGVVRQLRKIVGSNPSHLEAQLELCHAYACGYCGGLPRRQSYDYIRKVLTRSRPLHNKLVHFRSCISPTVRFILVDWIVEVASMKQFSPLTVHFAVYLIDHYLCIRRIDRSYVQLLGISCLLLSSRWTSDIILTIRESSWLTERTFTYDEVVRMMGDILAAFKGDVRGLTIPDCLDVLFKLTNADRHTCHIAHYLSESLIHHLVFTSYPAAHLAAACLLLARIFLDHDYPWPSVLVECMGFSLTEIQDCCLQVYQYCLTDKHSVKDSRLVKLEAVSVRYNSQEFGCISKQPFLTYQDVSKRLGISSDCMDSNSGEDAEFGMQNFPIFPSSIS